MLADPTAVEMDRGLLELTLTSLLHVSPQETGESVEAYFRVEE